MKVTKVTLRKKEIGKGKMSLYLDYYPPIIKPETGKKTRREFLQLYIHKRPKNAQERQSKKEMLILAEKICAGRQVELNNQEYGYSANLKGRKYFLEYFEEIVAEKSTSKGNLGNWKSTLYHLQNYLQEEVRMSEVDKQFVIGFKNYLNTTKLKQNSKVSYYRKLSAVLNQAVYDEIIEKNPCKIVKGFKEEETKREFLTTDEIKKVVNSVSDYPICRKSFLFSVFTGLRFSDIKGLKWSNIQINNDKLTLRYRQNKSKGYQTITLSNKAVSYLEERKDDNIPVFEGMPETQKMNYRLKKWLKKSGIKKHITFHCARHTYATLMLTLGADLYVISKMLGHKYIKTTEIYTKIIDQKMDEATDLLNELKL